MAGPPDRPELGPMAEVAERKRAVDHVLALLLDECGCDFHGYQEPFLLRRLQSVADRNGLRGGITQLAGAVHGGSPLLAQLVEALSLGVTAMFRDPGFWAGLRQLLQDGHLATDVLRCWVAGCATGEEAYSLSITLHEAGFTDHLVYATDISEASLAVATQCCRTRGDWEQAQRNYAAAGGSGDLAGYFAGPDHVDSMFRTSIFFARHNLATDAVFNSFDLVLCRNVLIYFNNDLRARAHRTLHDSLRTGGMLCLGMRESLVGTPFADGYRPADLAHQVYRRVD